MNIGVHFLNDQLIYFSRLYLCFLYRLDESPDLELLNVGDKVLEVNGVTVKEQSLDEVLLTKLLYQSIYMYFSRILQER